MFKLLIKTLFIENDKFLFNFSFEIFKKNFI